MFMSLFIGASCYNNFYFILEGYKKVCFTESTKKEGFYRFHIMAELYSINVEHTIPDEQMIRIYQTTDYKKTFTSRIDGDFILCVVSLTRSEQNIKIKITTGVSAKDFSEVVKESDLVPINEKVIFLFRLNL